MATDYNVTFEVVRKVTGISKKKIQSRSRLWDVLEARMLLILFCHQRGEIDQMTAWHLGRNRTTIYKTRVYAQEYITMNQSFRNKYNKILKLYDAAKSL